MSSSWQGSHYVVVIGAAGLAFAAGYTMGGRQQQRPEAIDVGNNVAAPVIPYEVNQAEAVPPPGRRGRPDENELIAANAEPEDGQQRPPATGRPPRDDGAPGGRGTQGRGSRDDRPEPPPPEEEFQQEEQDPYGPEGG